MQEQLHITIDGQLQEPSIVDRLAEATVTHFTAAFTGLKNKVQDMADEAYKCQHMKDMDAKLGSNLYGQYKAQVRHDKVAAMASQYDIKPIRDALGKYSLL